ncbi:hypothetical protein BU14_0220s0029 [Porphyra umbilicalis]|uniref:Uncharacterized protein n=1 Tax=Porphyra umbilicalis TaxID=2786 RepID=A0A1X6P4N1_PORUM|nr:hypothetical protein BU14_0220s0029 [Porphyra umbilicalis]|eukprot:OSX75798.1 hypothetical protein BU14_0220s0029 [Porphyra umbilicalis]
MHQWPPPAASSRPPPLPQQQHLDTGRPLARRLVRVALQHTLLARVVGQRGHAPFRRRLPGSFGDDLGRGRRWGAVRSAVLTRHVAHVIREHRLGLRLIVDRVGFGAGIAAAAAAARHHCHRRAGGSSGAGARRGHGRGAAAEGQDGARHKGGHGGARRRGRGGRE